MMAEFFLTIFIFAGVIAVTALVFGGWLVFTLARGIFGMLGFGRKRAPLQPVVQGRAVNYSELPQIWGPRPDAGAGRAATYPMPSSMVQCGVPGCRHLNPASARFCRRCGHAFPQGQRAVAGRRAAML